jgi:pyruvate dehydrogenase E1 component alpha subunit
LVENNLYGMGTPVAKASMNPNFHERLDMVPGYTVDGLNVFAMREAIRFAKKYAIENGPLCLNVITYRYHGHSMSDPGITYRTREEV